ncbi:MAG: hypothetical protein MJ121_03470 [Clostridia bacterium]|nr:hypothetical protein [Clostridia bacterium]
MDITSIITTAIDALTKVVGKFDLSKLVDVFAQLIKVVDMNRIIQAVLRLISAAI